MEQQKIKIQSKVFPVLNFPSLTPTKNNSPIPDLNTDIGSNISRQVSISANIRKGLDNYVRVLLDKQVNGTVKGSTNGLGGGGGAGLEVGDHLSRGGGGEAEEHGEEGHEVGEEGCGSHLWRFG